LGGRDRREGGKEGRLNWLRAHQAVDLFLQLLLFLVLFMHLCYLPRCYYARPLSTGLDHIECDLMQLQDSQEEVLDMVVVRNLLELEALNVIKCLSKLLWQVIKNHSYYLRSSLCPQNIVSCVCSLQAPRQVSFGQKS